ncbi:MAG: hypothetical protein ACI3YH_00240 [Eubacteriales bacterium]
MTDPIHIVVSRYSRVTGEKVEEERIPLERSGATVETIKQVVDNLNVWASLSQFGHREVYSVPGIA